jgi:predicted O-methyltransferase YrrM
MSAEDAVRDVLRRTYGDAAAAGTTSFIRAGMEVTELVRLYELIRAHGCRTALEIGMASGTSSVVISQALRDNGGGRLTSVDPFQTAADGYAGKGVASLAAAGLSDGHRLIEKLNYLALPELVAEVARFDFVFIDGYHSFDYTFVDFFYADLLLNVGGVLAIHDTVMPGVYRAVRFIEELKPYKRLSAPVMMRLESFPRRLFRRVGQILGGPTALREAHSRRREWFALAAYQKLADQQVPEEHAVDF